MAFKRSKTIHVTNNRRRLQRLPWYAKSWYLGDRAITQLIENITSKVRNFLHSTIDIKKEIVLKNQPNPYDGWWIENKGDEINIYVEKSMYFNDITHYHDQIEKINLICFHWPISSPRLILDYFFNNWVLNITYHTLQNLDPLFNWVSQIARDLNHHKMIYDFTTSFVSTPWWSKKLIQKINHHFSHMKSRFCSSSPRKSSK